LIRTTHKHKKTKSKDYISKKLPKYIKGEILAIAKKEIIAQVRQNATEGDAIAQFSLGVALQMGRRRPHSQGHGESS
jgi:hypothetical protein